MAALSEKDLEQKREKNARLREQIAEAEAQAAERLQEKSAEIEGKQLDAETARLEAQLAAAREAAKASVANSGAAGPLEAVTREEEAAQAGMTPPGVAVDTNAGSDNDSDNENEE
jgi:hypothetical protein